MKDLSWDDDELRNILGDEFEQLEYNPGQVEQLVTAAMRQLEGHR